MCFIAYGKDCHVFVIMKNLIFFIQVSALNGDHVSFFVSYVKPHNCVSPKSLSRWIVTLLSSAGVDTSAFKAHSTRSAAGVLLQKSLSYVDICKLADWSTKSGVFETFYLRYLWNLMRHILWIFLWIFFSGPRSNKLHFSSFTSFTYFTCLSLLPFLGKSLAFQSYHCKAELNLCYINQYLIK